MQTLVISIYDNKEHLRMSAGVFDGNDIYPLDEVYVHNLYNVYAEHYWNSEALVEKARSLNFGDVIICENGGMIYKQF